MSRWNRDTLDCVLIRHHTQGHTDSAITSLMLDAGHAVAISDVGQARRRLKLPANTPSPPPQDQHRVFKDRPNPLAQAKAWLGSRLVEKHEGGRMEYRLDGRPTDLTKIMKAYNAMRVAMNMPQVLDNATWRV
jgi:hypothetical protein